MPLKSYYKSSDGAFTLLLGDCRQLLSQFDFQFDMIFADPPYFLSNGGISVQSGKIVCVDKGDWDRSFGKETKPNTKNSRPPTSNNHQCLRISSIRTVFSF